MTDAEEGAKTRFLIGHTSKVGCSCRIPQLVSKQRGLCCRLSKFVDKFLLHAFEAA